MFHWAGHNKFTFDSVSLRAMVRRMLVRSMSVYPSVSTAAGGGPSFGGAAATVGAGAATAGGGEGRTADTGSGTLATGTGFRPLSRMYTSISLQQHNRSM